MLYQTNRHNWKLSVIQKVIDMIAADRPTTAYRAKENQSRLCKWAIARGHCETNPVEHIERPTFKPKQRLPNKQLTTALIILATKTQCKRLSTPLWYGNN